jgi:hypothetical protein
MKLNRNVHPYCSQTKVLGMRINIGLILALLMACGSSDGPAGGGTEAGAEYRDADVELAIVDSIGVEHGDSNLVLGTTAGCCCLPEGRVAVADMDRCRVGVFTRKGEFLRSVGRPGSGPGEFMMPGAAAVTPSGGLAVSDFGAMKLVLFDSDLSYAGELGGFFPAPPQNLIFLDDSSFVGSTVAYETGGETMEAGFLVGRWDLGSVQPEVVYARELAPFDPQDMFNTEAPEILFTASADGTVYTSARSTEEFVFGAWNPDGSELFTVREPYRREAKTREELELERQLMRELFTSRGVPAEMAESIEPEPYRYAIGGLGIAPDGNLWVREGARRHPVFRVYHPASGEYLHTVSMDSTAYRGELEVRMNSWGFTAWDAMSRDWPRVYVLETVSTSEASDT